MQNYKFCIFNMEYWKQLYNFLILVIFINTTTIDYTSRRKKGYFIQNGYIA